MSKKATPEEKRSFHFVGTLSLKDGFRVLVSKKARPQPPQPLPQDFENPNWDEPFPAFPPTGEAWQEMIDRDFDPVEGAPINSLDDALLAGTVAANERKRARETSATYGRTGGRAKRDKRGPLARLAQKFLEANQRGRWKTKTERTGAFLKAVRERKLEGLHCIDYREEAGRIQLLFLGSPSVDCTRRAIERALDRAHTLRAAPSQDR